MSKQPLKGACKGTIFRQSYGKLSTNASGVHCFEETSIDTNSTHTVSRKYVRRLSHVRLGSKRMHTVGVW